MDFLSIFLLGLLALMAVLGLMVWWMGVMERRRNEKAWRKAAKAKGQK